MKVFYRPSAYTDDAIQGALRDCFGAFEHVEDASLAHLQVADYEELDFQAALDNKNCWICAYSIRKALIRKHFLSQTVREYVAKNSASILADAVPETWNLEVDYAEFLDDALDEAFELRGELEMNKSRAADDRKWFILKPGMAERGAGLRLFSSIEELTTIFEDMEPTEDEDVPEQEVADDSGVFEHGASAGIMTSDMRFFVVQEYLSKPLLLAVLGYRKFHIRAYVLAIGSISVFVHDNMLVLSSAEAYEAPTSEIEDLAKHLTNTCYQMAMKSTRETQTVHAFWDVEDNAFEKHKIHQQIKDITGQVFDAASAQRINFQTLPNAFEIFGLDFLVDNHCGVSLLEVNAYPDFAQTGAALGCLVHQVAREMIELVAVQMQRCSDVHISQACDYKGFQLCLAKKIL